MTWKSWAYTVTRSITGVSTGHFILSRPIHFIVNCAEGAFTVKQTPHVSVLLPSRLQGGSWERKSQTEPGLFRRSWKALGLEPPSLRKNVFGTCLLTLCFHLPTQVATKPGDSLAEEGEGMGALLVSYREDSCPISAFLLVTIVVSSFKCPAPFSCLTVFWMACLSLLFACFLTPSPHFHWLGN